MELNLEAARFSREIEERIKKDLLRLSPEARKSVLERVIVDVLPALTGATEKPPVSEAPSTSESDKLWARAVSVASESTSKQWERIEAYCLAHPSPDGKYCNVDVAQALDPKKLKENRNLAISTIYTATKRRSVGESGDPRFVLLGNATFRLATAEERARAKKSDGKVRLPGNDRPATERIVALLDSEPETDFRAETVEERLGVSLRLARDTLGGLAKDGRIVRTATALYRSARSARAARQAQGATTTNATANLSGRNGGLM